jgi:hypothetical protein
MWKSGAGNGLPRRAGYGTDRFWWGGAFNDVHQEQEDAKEHYTQAERDDGE